MLRGNKSLCIKSGSYAQHGHHAQKSSPELEGGFSKSLVCSIRDLSPSIIACTNDDPTMTLTYFTARSILETGFMIWEKSESNECFGNYCSLRPETWQIQTTNEVSKGMRLFKVIS